ncbi:MAG: orotidine-5'-phosphate decarboxylase [Spirochaetota bacterium]
MFHQKFTKRRNTKKTILCVGLDPDIEKIPSAVAKGSEPLFHFSQRIVDETHRYASCYKINIAFFERFGSAGLMQFEKLVRYIKLNYDGIPILADAKRGDLANTAKEYANYYFENLHVDAITLSPYMGVDSIVPFLKVEKSFVFLLCLTSNPGSQDLQTQKLYKEENMLYHKVAELANSLNKEYINRVGIVVGATHPRELANLRKMFPDLLFLIPGFGAQGGGLSETFQAAGQNSILNSSRQIIFAESNDEYGLAAGVVARQVSEEISRSRNSSTC